MGGGRGNLNELNLKAFWKFEGIARRGEFEGIGGGEFEGIGGGEFEGIGRRGFGVILGNLMKNYQVS